MRKSKKGLAWMLACLMMLSVLPQTTLASEIDNGQANEETSADFGSESAEMKEAAADNDVGKEAAADDDVEKDTAADNDMEEEGDFGEALLSDGTTYHVWFDGTIGLQELLKSSHAGMSPYYEGATDTCVEVTDGWVTLPETAGETAKYGYTLNGWYDVYNGIYYGKDMLGREIEVTKDTVFYADWIASNYSLGNSERDKVTDQPNTSGFIETDVFDYNELFNIRSTANDSTDSRTYVNGDNHAELWRLNESLGFAFLNWAYDDLAKARTLGSIGDKDEKNKSLSEITPNIISDSNGTVTDKGQAILDALFTKSDELGRYYLGTGEGLYQYVSDEDDDNYGYYYYDSSKNGASYNQSEQRFVLYSDPEYILEQKLTNNSWQYKTDKAKTTGFLPFNDNESGEYNEKDGSINYWFGMQSTVNFWLPNDPGNGGNKADTGKDMEFRFSGDDDVWVFVDDTLVLDLGGIHGARRGSINFSTGEIETEIEKNKFQTTYLADSIKSGDHKLTIYYLERGSSQSNCSIYFNIAPKYALTLMKQDADNASALQGARFGVYSDEACTIPAELYCDVNESGDPVNEFVTGEDGTATGYGMVAGNTYYVKELAAPDGYHITDGDPIRIALDVYGKATVDDGVVFEQNKADKRYYLTVTNERDKGSLTISKTVTGTGTPDADTTFEFTVTKNSMPATGKYSIDGGAAQDIPSDGKISFKAGQSALLTGLETGEYTVTETTPAQENYKSTTFSVNDGTVESGCSATVTVFSAEAANGGWKKENGNLVTDDDGYFTYTLTSDQIDAEGNITVDCNLLAEYMEAQMQNYQNYAPRSFKIKFVNETGDAIRYQDYEFDTVNWIPVGETYTPSGSPTMKDTNENSSSTSAGYGWGEVWQSIYSFLIGESNTAGSLDAEGFDGNKVRAAIAPLRCINPAVVSYFSSNPGQGTLTGNSTTNSAQTITLQQKNALPKLIKQAFTFKNWEGTEISLSADDSRTYADFICAFYGVDSLDELTVAQKYNVLGTGYKGSPAMPYEGQSHITTYYSNLAGTMANWCIPYAALNDGSLDYFKTWGFSNTRIEAGKKLISGGQEFSTEDAATYAYQQNYFLLENDPEVLKMAYEYLYDRCIRFSLDSEDRPVSTAIDNNAASDGDVGGIKAYLDKTESATANVLKAMNNGAEVADGESITLDRVKGYIEVPNAWNQFRYYDFGFKLVFKADAKQPAAAVAFTNNYQEDDTPTPTPTPTPPAPEDETGNLTVSKIVAGNAGDTNKDFNFTVKLGDDAISGSYGDMTFENGISTFTLKHNELKTATGLPAGISYEVTESEANQDGYTTTSTGATGNIVKNETAAATFTNTKNSSSDTPKTPDNPNKPIVPTTEVPKTGDESNGNFWLALVIVSFGAFAGACIYGRKRRYTGHRSQK